jgi:type I restriction enzyme S subunit
MLFTRLAEGVVQLPDFSAQQKASACLAAIPAIQKAAGAQLADIEKLPAALLRQAFAGTI